VGVQLDARISRLKSRAMQFARRPWQEHGKNSRKPS